MAIRDFHRALNDLLFFVMRQRWRFAGRADSDNSADSSHDLGLD